MCVTTTIEPVHAMDVDFGRPQWQFGMSTWAFADASRIVVTYQQRGRWRLATIDAQTGVFTPVPVDLEPGDNIAATPSHAVLVAGSVAAPEALVRDRSGDRHCRDDPGGVRGRDRPRLPVDAGGDRVSDRRRPDRARVLLRAAQPGLQRPRRRAPPLIVIGHGGPTASTSARLNLEVQYWTSRGFAVVDVNYRGSSGYGRAYRRQLAGQWGVADVADCVNAARYLAAQGQADRDRLDHPRPQRRRLHDPRGADLSSGRVLGRRELLRHQRPRGDGARDAQVRVAIPRQADCALSRAPGHLPRSLPDPLCRPDLVPAHLVPGTRGSRGAAEPVADDRGRPAGRGIPVALLTFAGEQHGFRKRESIVRCLEAELYFYGAVFGFAPADTLPPVTIANLDRWPPR